MYPLVTKNDNVKKKRHKGPRYLTHKTSLMYPRAPIRHLVYPYSTEALTKRHCSPVYSLVTKQHCSYNTYPNNIVSYMFTILTQQCSSAMYPAMRFIKYIFKHQLTSCHCFIILSKWLVHLQCTWFLDNIHVHISWWLCYKVIGK